MQFQYPPPVEDRPRVVRCLFDDQLLRVDVERLA